MDNLRILEIPGKPRYRVAARMRDGAKQFYAGITTYAFWNDVEIAKLYEDYGDARLEARVQAQNERHWIFDTMVLDENGYVISAHMWDKDIESPKGELGGALNFGDL